MMQSDRFIGQRPRHEPEPEGFPCIKCGHGVRFDDRRRRYVQNPESDEQQYQDDVYECRNCGLQYDMKTRIPWDISDKEYYALRFDKIENLLNKILKREFTGSVKMR